MKTLKIILIFILVLALCVPLVGTFAGMSTCIEDYGSYKYDAAINSVYEACQQGKQHIENVESCYMEVQEKFYIPYKYVEVLLKFTGSVTTERMKEFHNNICTSIPGSLFVLE